jgi:D-sedoheptulose 7-phosphate isomerase
LIKRRIKMNYLDNLTVRYPELAPLKEKIGLAVDMIIESYKKGGKVLLCGNGGSAADSEHISGELLKGFMELRRPEGEELAALTEALGEDAPKLQRGVAAVPLTSLSASLSAFANDVDPELVFAQLTYALGKKEDVLICLSTSGNSKNVVKAAKVAKALGIKTIGMSGEGGGAFLSICDVTINAPSRETYKVQEYHLPIYHAICAEVERILFVK